jgi:peptide/nickel transport system substrate-binding protein
MPEIITATRLRAGRRSQIGRRGFIAGSAGAALLAGCRTAGKRTPASGGSAASADESTLTPQHGGVFQTLGFRALEHLNSLTVVTPNNDFYFCGVYDTLVDWEYDPFQDYRAKYKLAPSLAQSWEQPNNTTYVFHLRHDVKWHDGAPFTAADVQFAYAYTADPANKSPYTNYFKNMASLTVPDDYTVQIQTKTPDVSFIKFLLGPTQILPRHVHDRGDQFEKVAIGTGPFKIDSYNQETGVVYSANKSYWKPGQPYLDGWRVLAPGDDSARIAAFVAGKNDALHLTDRRQVNTVLGLVKNARVMNFIRDNCAGMFMKLDKPPFSDKRVREAVNMIIDRPAMLKTLHGGDGSISPPGINAIAQGWAIPQADLVKLPGWRDPKSQDLNDAKQLLAEAGYGNGGLTFTISFDQTVDYVKADVTVIAEQLRTAGVTANLEPLEPTIFLKNFTTGNYTALADAQGGGNSAPGDGPWQRVYPSGAFYNKMPINDAQLDQLIEAQGQEFDQAKRQALFLQIERILADQVYSIPFASEPGYFVGQSYLHGWCDNMTLNVDDEEWGSTWFDQASAPKNRS